MTPAAKGGKAAITQIGTGKYRIFNTAKDSGDVSYSDDFGKTWNKCSGIPSQYGSKPTMLLVEPDDPETVYAYATYFNSSWHYSKDEPTAEDAQYKFCVSTDGGKTFTATDVCMYDQCDSAGRIAYLGKGELVLGGGWYGMYRASVKSGKGQSQRSTASATARPSATVHRKSPAASIRSICTASRSKAIRKAFTVRPIPAKHGFASTPIISTAAPATAISSSAI